MAKETRHRVIFLKSERVMRMEDMVSASTPTDQVKAHFVQLESIRKEEEQIQSKIGEIAEYLEEVLFITKQYEEKLQTPNLTLKQGNFSTLK